MSRVIWSVPLTSARVQPLLRAKSGSMLAAAAAPGSIPRLRITETTPRRPIRIARSSRRSASPAS